MKVVFTVFVVFRHKSPFIPVRLQINVKFVVTLLHTVLFASSVTFTKEQVGHLSLVVLATGQKGLPALVAV